MYVANTTGNYVSVFTTAGDYVTVFGVRGEGKGEFRHPCVVCVDEDGFVFVSEYWNDRIQCL